MANPFALRRPDLAGPATDIVPVTPSNTVDLVDFALALYVEVAGVVVFDTIKGATRTVNVPANFTIPCGVKRVRATGTTATGIHALVL